MQLKIHPLILALLLIGSPVFAISKTDVLPNQKEPRVNPKNKGGNPLMDMTLLKGKCTKVSLFSKEVEEACDRSTNLRYKNSRSGFWFFLNDYIITFSGIDMGSPPIAKHKRMQRVDLLLITKTRGLSAKDKYFSDKVPKTPTPKKFNATGLCAWEDPYRSVPTRINCLAKTKKGEFYVEFDHDGSKPKILLKNGKGVKKKS